MRNLILASYLMITNLTYSQMPNFFIDIKEIEISQSNGVLGNTGNLISGTSELNDLIVYNFYNMNKFLKREDVLLKRNPLLKILLASKIRCSDETKSEKLQEYLNEKFKLTIDSTYQNADFIIITSFGKIESNGIDVPIREASSGVTDSVFIFKNNLIPDILRVFNFEYHLKVAVDEEQFPNHAIQRISFEIPLNSLKSKELFMKKLKELGVEFHIEERGYYQYRVSN